MLKKLVAFLSLALLSVHSIAHAVPADEEFKSAKKRKRLVLSECALFDDVEKVIIEEQRYVSVRGTTALKNTERERLSSRYRLFACGLSDIDSSKVALWARDSLEDTPVEFTFEASDFPERENNLGARCRNVLPWPGSYIYKVEGSSHIPGFDCRRNSFAVIVKPGGGPRPSTSCVDMFDEDGNVVGKAGAYSPAGIYPWRGYGCHGCSSDGSPSALQSRIRRNTGNYNLYIDIGNTCYGPIDARRCKNSSAC